MIHIITTKATAEQIKDMLEALETCIKLAVDVRHRIIAGGGGMHADAEAVLLEEGSQQSDVWGASWYPESQEVRFESLINIRPKQGNRSIVISDPTLRDSVEAIVLERFVGK